MEKRQTKMHVDTIKFYKLKAIKQDVLLPVLFEEAIKLFLKKRKKNKDSIMYLVSPKKGKELNVLFSEALLNEIATVIKKDKVSMRRFLFTALFEYEQKHISQGS